MTNLIKLHRESASISAKLEYLATIMDIINDSNKDAKRALNKGIIQTVISTDNITYEFTIKRKTQK